MESCLYIAKKVFRNGPGMYNHHNQKLLSNLEEIVSVNFFSGTGSVGRYFPNEDFNNHVLIVIKGAGNS